MGQGFEMPGQGVATPALVPPHGEDQYWVAVMLQGFASQGVDVVSRYCTRGTSVDGSMVQVVQSDAGASKLKGVSTPPQPPASM